MPDKVKVETRGATRAKFQIRVRGTVEEVWREIGLNAEDLQPGDRLVALKPGGMCQYKERLSSPDEVDDKLVGWIKAAYDAAG